MSVTPSIFVRSLRTEAAQPPQTIFGTLSDTRIPSAAATATGSVVAGVSVTGVVAVTGEASAAAGGSTARGADSSEHPTIDTMAPAAISIGTNFFTINLQNKTQNNRDHRTSENTSTSMITLTRQPLVYHAILG